MARFVMAELHAPLSKRRRHACENVSRSSSMNGFRAASWPASEQLSQMANLSSPSECSVRRVRENIIDVRAVLQQGADDVSVDREP